MPATTPTAATPTATGPAAPSLPSAPVPPTRDGEADRCLAAAVEIGSRLADGRSLATAIDAWRRRTTLPFAWGHASLLTGSAGPALLDRALWRATADETWADRARDALAAAARSTVEDPLRGPGTDGTGGLLLAVADAASDDDRYRPSLRALASRAAEQVSALPPTDPRGQGESAVDVVAGRAGAVLGLVAACDADPGGDQVRAATAAVVADLVRSCPPAAPGPVGHLAVRAGSGEAVDRAAAHPHGHVDLGVAHGLPGVLAALAAARTAGTDVPGLEDAMRALVGVVVGRAVHDDAGLTWTSTAGTAPDGSWLPVDEHPARPGWCYGSPGVAAALASAARAVGDEELRALALGALAAEVARGSFARGLPSPTLCHGTAGMLAAALATASTTGGASAVAAAGAARDALLRGLDPAAPLGVRDEEVPGVRVDNAGLLCGATGVALALLDAAAPTRTTPTTARLLALA